jgi:hypothetical protein
MFLAEIDGQVEGQDGVLRAIGRFGKAERFRAERIGRLFGVSFGRTL